MALLASLMFNEEAAHQFAKENPKDQFFAFFSKANTFLLQRGQCCFAGSVKATGFCAVSAACLGPKLCLARLQELEPVR